MRGTASSRRFLRHGSRTCRVRHEVTKQRLGMVSLYHLCPPSVAGFSGFCFYLPSKKRCIQNVDAIGTDKSASIRRKRRARWAVLWAFLVPDSVPAVRSGFLRVARDSARIQVLFVPASTI